jgi:hypothetical protein
VRTRAVVVLEPSQVQYARTVAAEHDVKVEQVPNRGIEPISTATLVLVGTAAVVGAVVHILEQHKGGQVIDLRPGAPKAFYRSRDVIYGMVIIVARDGKVTVTIKEPADMFGKVIATLPKLIVNTGSAKQVAELVNETYGEEVQTEAEDHPTLDGDV